MPVILLNLNQRVVQVVKVIDPYLEQVAYVQLGNGIICHQLIVKPVTIDALLVALPQVVYHVKTLLIGQELPVDVKMDG